VKYLQESPGNSYYDQAAASTSGERQVLLSEDSFIYFEAEAGDGHAPQKPPPGGSQNLRSVTTGSAVGEVRFDKVCVGLDIITEPPPIFCPMNPKPGLVSYAFDQFTAVPRVLLT
jgi:hypothetical protein